MAESCELIACAVFFLSQSNLLERLSWGCTLIRILVEIHVEIRVVIMLAFLMGSWMSSSGFMGVTQLNVSVIGMSFPF